jgi:hypothetical protein
MSRYADNDQETEESSLAYRRPSRKRDLTLFLFSFLNSGLLIRLEPKSRTRHLEVVTKACCRITLKE